MSSARIALTADDRQFQATLKSATQSVDKFGKSVETNAVKGSQSFEKLQNSLSGLEQKIRGLDSGFNTVSAGASRLGTAIVGIGMAQFVADIFNTSSSIKDMATGFGLTVESVLELKAGFDKAGISTEQMNKMLNALALSTEEAMSGNTALQYQFKKLGIDLDKLSNTTLAEKWYLISKSMREAGGSSDSLRAATDLLGKSALALNGKWEDVETGISGAAGKMGDASGKVEALDEANKKLEQSAQKIKDAFRDLFGKYLADIATFISETGNAEKMAGALGVAMSVIATGAIASGFKTIVEVVGGLAKTFLALIPTVTAGAGATEAFTFATGRAAQALAAEGVALAAMVGPVGALATATAAQARAQETLTILQTQNTASTVALAKAQDALTSANIRVAAATQGVAAAQAEVNATLNIGAVSATTAATATTGFSAALSALGARIAAMLAPLASMGAGLLAVVGIASAPAWATIAVAVGVITAAVAAATVVWKAFGEEIKAFASKIVDFFVKAFLNVELALNKAAAGLRKFFGKPESAELKADIDDITKRLANLDKAKQEASKIVGGGNGKRADANTDPRVLGKVPANAGAGAPTGAGPAKKAGEQTGGDGKAALKPYLAQIEAMKQQANLADLAKQQEEQRLILQKNLVGASQEEAAFLTASLAARQKKETEVAKIKADIAKLNKQIANTEEKNREPLNAQLGLLQEQLKETQSQVDTTSNLIADTTVLKQVEAERLYMLDLQSKTLQSIADMDRTIADFSRGEDARKLAAIEAQIKAEEDAAIKRRQNELGATPMSQDEANTIRGKVRESMQGLIDKQKELNAAQANAEAVKFGLDLQNTAIQEGIKLRAQMAELTMSEDERQINAIKTQNALLAEQEIARRRAKLGAGQDISEAEKASIRDQVSQQNQKTLDETQALIDKSREWSTGWNKAFADYASNANNSAKQAQSYFETFTQGFEDAFVNFVKTGKLSFTDLVNTMIAQFARIQAQKMITGLMGGGSGGGGGFLSGLFGGGGGGGSIFSSIGKIFGFANGGNPPVGVPSLVGERGPELFVPRSAGTIVPNNMLGGQPQQNITQVTYNINATDAQSFKQQLARDPSFVHAVVEQGKRNTPASARR